MARRMQQSGSRQQQALQQAAGLVPPREALHMMKIQWKGSR
jgi:hypothetical protein